MTLQNIVNQTWYAARTATLGIALGFALAGAPGLTYAYGQASATPAPIPAPPPMQIPNPPNPLSTINPIPAVALGLPLTSAPRGAYRISQNYAPPVQQQLWNSLFSDDLSDNGLNTWGGIDPEERGIDDFPGEYGGHSSPLEDLVSRLSPAQQRQFYLLAKRNSLSEQQLYDFFRSQPAAPDNITQLYDDSPRVKARVEFELMERLSSPSLHKLQERYRQVEHNVPQGSTVYKAEFLPGYYVHYPQARRIYYVERGDVAGKGRTTVAKYIADENGKVLYRADKQGKMVAVQSPAQKASLDKNVSQSPAEKEVKQPTAADIGIFQNIFDCQSKLELYSATGAGVGSLAIIGPLAALYIRHRRRRSHQK